MTTPARAMQVSPRELEPSNDNSTQGDASVPTLLNTTPAPTRAGTLANEPSINST